jgi:hypothetical protein
MRIAIVLAMLVASATADPQRMPAWQRISQVGRCRVQLEPAGQGERDDLVAMARDRLLAPVDATPTLLGDRLERIDGKKLARPAKPPRTDTDAKRIASDALARTADLLGVAFELPHIDLVPRAFGRGWIVSAVVRRTSIAAQSYETVAQLAIEIERDGRVASITVGAQLLPRFSICDGPRLRKDNPKLLANVIGATTPGRPIERSDITAIDAGVIKLGEFEYAVGYKITVSTERGRFRFNVDGDTGDLWSIDPPVGIGEP